MNSIGFFFNRVAWQFGIRRERARWGAVNRETQILSEAEDLLGKLAWRDVRDIDDLSGEYWQIHDLQTRQEELRAETRRLTEKNEALQTQLDEIEGAHDAGFAELKEKKSRRMEEALGVMQALEQHKEWKETTKRKFLTLRAKVKVLGKQDTDMSAEIEKTRASMNRLKAEFAEDMAEIEKKTAEIEKIEAEVTEIERQLSEGRAKLKEETGTLTSEISKLSKQIADISAKIGSLENEKGEFYYQVGHFLSQNLDSKEGAIRAVLKKHRPLVSRIAYFRRSIAFNQRLARRTQG